MASTPTSTTPVPVRRQGTKNATPTRTQCGAEKGDFNIVSIHTAKCSICDKRNGTDQMLRCRGCTWQICQPCQVEREKAGRSLAHGNLMPGAPSTVRRRRVLHTLKAPEVNGKQGVATSVEPKVGVEREVTLPAQTGNTSGNTSVTTPGQHTFTLASDNVASASAEPKVGVEREGPLAAQPDHTPGQHTFTLAQASDNVTPASSSARTIAPTNTDLLTGPSVLEAITSPLSYQRQSLARQVKTHKSMAASDISSDSEYVATDLDSPVGKVGSKRRLDKVTSHDDTTTDKPLEKRARTGPTNQPKTKQSSTGEMSANKNNNDNGSGNGAPLDPQAAQLAAMRAYYGAAMPTYAGGEHLLGRPVPAVFHQNQTMMPPQPTVKKPRLTGEQLMERVRKSVRVKLHTQYGWPICGPTNSEDRFEISLEDHNTLEDVAELAWRLLCKEAERCKDLSETQLGDVRTVIMDAARSFGLEVHSNFPQVFQNLAESRLGLEIRFLTNEQKGKLISHIKEAADGKIKDLLDGGGVMSTSERFTKDSRRA